MQTEAALRMATAGLEVTRLDVDPGEILSDPDFPGMEAPRTALPVVAGAAGRVGSPRRVIIAGHIDTVSAGGARAVDGRPVRRRDPRRQRCTAAARWT